MRERKREGEREVKIVSRDVNNYHASNLQKVINKKAKKKKKEIKLRWTAQELSKKDKSKQKKAQVWFLCPQNKRVK